MRISLLISIVLLALVHRTEADWWDSLTDKVSNVFTSAADWWKTDGAPKVRETFDSTKEKLKDPEFHRSYMQWIKEKAIAAKEFADAEIMPHVKDIYNAGQKAFKDLGDDNPTKQSPISENQVIDDSEKL